ncbi:BRCT domain-containing protein [Limnoglobus roseus]|uniref:DNA ligase n=1 Tax=Limnoglobus roseus TaxID=2598579 RepID=A0A5C1A631_9BACT|nr:BRCT domain-containing protein [Limnoglobus roseus]QEL13292.1 DNA ligase [Limnoglobus roseus]
MSATLTLNDLRKAWDTHDPQFVSLLNQLATQTDPQPEQPLRDGAPTFYRWLNYLRSWDFKRLPKEQQGHARVERLKAVEAADTEVKLPERLKSHEIILSLWQSNDPLAREILLDAIATVPLVYGPWRALKRIFKEAEAKHDTEVYGALAARFDAAFAGTNRGSVSGATLAYLARRAWRYLRRVAVQLPATYADVATDFLARYPEGTNLKATWLANHVFFHDKKNYGRSNFQWGYRDTPSPSDLKHRAFADLWKRSPRPLFALLERARADFVREFATAALKADFKQVLRDVEAAWVVRLVEVPSVAVHNFVVWILQNVPKFEQGAFRTLGLHDAVMKLFDSPSATARKYAAEYARTHARDLSVEVLVRLANNSNDVVRKLAQDLIGERDPRKDIGLTAWGQLLESEHGHKFAADVLVKAFGAKDLTAEWFRDRLMTQNSDAFAFVSKLLPKVHPIASLGSTYFVDLIRRAATRDDDSDDLVTFAEECLAKFDLATIPRDDLRFLALFPGSADVLDAWVIQGKLKPQALGVEFWKALAFHPEYEADPWLTDFRAKNGEWAANLQFNETRSTSVLGWLADVRQFGSTELGFDWLMKLVARGETKYHDFATDRMIRSFTPADFATEQSPPVATGGLSPPPTATDLKKATFLFTGKLATMTRDVSEAKVKDANGTVAGSVTKNLAYLVIGDDGSPLYGQGKKGSKQVKAEELNAAGANIQIISETRFLEMLAGQTAAPASADRTLAGCQKLWAMVTAPGPSEAALGEFARKYIRRHHPAICQHETERPVDPGAEIPAIFLTWDRVEPLFRESRKPIRDFAMELAKWEFARWNPPADDLVQMSENPYADVRRFVAKALLAEANSETKTYRIDPAALVPAAAYRFCESADDETRALGMELIRRLPKLRVPEELFRLTESTDRRVRAFVIRALWAAYRDRFLTSGWKPPVPPKPQVGVKAKKAAEKFEAEQGDGVPVRPAAWPAAQPTLAEFLRRVLFELPPGPPEKSKVGEPAEGDEKDKKVVTTKPIPARRAKLDAVETMRDLALDDAAFAKGVLPLLEEFMTSRGVSERAACLVAVTRIKKTLTTENTEATEKT